jgi:hypothetical protein
MKEAVLTMHYIPTCTTLITTVITATGGTCDDTQQLHASVTRAAQAAAARGGQRGFLPARVRDQAAALANLLIVLELLDPDGAATAPSPVLAGWAALWRALDTHGLTTPAWRAVFQGIRTGPSVAQRWAACQQPASALAYARRVDRTAHAQTRAAACASPTAAVLYARLLDRGPHPDTQAAAGQQPATAEQYAVLMAALHALAVDDAPAVPDAAAHPAPRLEAQDGDGADDAAAWVDGAAEPRETFVPDPTLALPFSRGTGPTLISERGPTGRGALPPAGHDQWTEDQALQLSSLLEAVLNLLDQTGPAYLTAQHTGWLGPLWQEAVGRLAAAGLAGPTV